MGEIVLTEHQFACRAAHEQVQFLRHLYQDIAADEPGCALPGFGVEARKQELQEFRRLLSGKLKELELLPMRPDPEREGVIAVFTKVRDAFSREDGEAIGKRLIAEERELLRLGESLLAHDHDDALDGSVARTRTAIDRLMASISKVP